MVSALEKFGVISICIITLHLTRKMSDFFYKRSITQYYKKQRLKELGQWGVVVGADKNMGQAYAVELAKQGLNVVIIGSNLPKLTTLSNLLEKYFQVFTGVISLTFTSNEFKYIEKALWNLDVAILVNAPDYAIDIAQPDSFFQVPEFDLALSSLVSKNLIVTTRMCAIELAGSIAFTCIRFSLKEGFKIFTVGKVMPGMVSKGKGIIINVASVTLETNPLMALSEASAAYIEKLTEGLQNQYSCTGVVIQSLIPGYTLGNRLAKKNLLVLWAKDCIHKMIRSFGLEREKMGRLACFLVHTIQGLCLKTSIIRVKNLSASSELGCLLNEK